VLDHAQAIVYALQRFAFVYPFVLAGGGAVFSWWFEEREGIDLIEPPLPGARPSAAVIVPGHNEAPQMRETIRALSVWLVIPQPALRCQDDHDHAAGEGRGRRRRASRSRRRMRSS
jgi:hypothetical protein